MTAVLTIAIPARNQAEDLAQTLGSVDRALQEMPTFLLVGIEVLISSNGSSDATQAIASEWVEATQIHGTFVQQTHDLGFNGNFSYLAQAANGQWIWFLGCGELIDPTTLKVLLPNLLQAQPLVASLESSESILLGEEDDFESR